MSRRIANVLISAVCLWVLAAAATWSDAAIPIRHSYYTENAEAGTIDVAMRGGGGISGSRSGMGGPPIIYLPPSGPSMRSPGLRSPSLRAPTPRQVGRPYGNQRLYHQKNSSWGKAKRPSFRDESGRRKNTAWKKSKSGWKPGHCKGRHCHRHRYKNRYYYAYYDDWYDYYDYYDGPVRYDDAHTRWCKKRYRSYNVRTDRYLGYDGRFHRCRSPFTQ